MASGGGRGGGGGGEEEKEENEGGGGRFIYLFTILVNLTTPLVTQSEQQLLEGERPTKEYAVIALKKIFRIMIQAYCINSLWLNHF